MRESELIAVTLPCLCEFVWVLSRVYRFGKQDIANALNGLIDAGLAVSDAGGDFADGLIAYEGRWLGGETFVSLDQQAVSLLAKQGQKTRLLTNNS